MSGLAPQHAVVLAGGRSSRLHASSPTPVPDKPLLKGPAGLSLLGRSLELLRTVAGIPAERTVVVGPPDLELPPGARLVREDPPFSGPASAVRAGLLALSTDESEPYRVLVLAADMPAAGPALRALVRAARRNTVPEAALIGEDGGILQPLLALVPYPEALRAFDEDSAHASVRSRLRRLEPVPVPVPAGSCADVDTWEDARRLGYGNEERDSDGTHLG